MTTWSQLFHMIFGNLAQFWDDFTTAIVTEGQQSFQIFLDSIWIHWTEIGWLNIFDVLPAILTSLYNIFDGFLTLIEQLALTIPFAFFESLRTHVKRNIPKAWSTQVMSRKQAFELTVDLLLDEAPRSVADITGQPLVFGFVIRLRTMLRKLVVFRNLERSNILKKFFESKVSAFKNFMLFKFIAILFAGFRFWGMFCLAFVALVFLERVSRTAEYGKVFQQATKRRRVRVANKVLNAGRISIRRRMTGGNIP